MFGIFRRDRGAGDIAHALYGAIVAQARQPALYADFGVPDTVEGRFEMVVLHLALLLRRLRGEGEAGRAAGQHLFDLFCADMDRSLRAMGVGDLGVPKRMKKMGEAFYGRAAAYDAAIDAGDRQALADAFARNVFAGTAAGGAAPMAEYALTILTDLGGQAGSEILAGRVIMPAAVAPERAGLQ
ncbi:MAG TPA: ubiquinol-cytochrome C chaperone family protein [Bauldia sp.]|nr:ubiquinol-cytochrome C chaperone family protein [Bauldia sp.]